MVQRLAPTLAELYEADETAWLDAMAELAAQRRVSELDLRHLGEYLGDMAARDRREVESRLTILVAHLLKWTHQPSKRTKSWARTVLVQRQALARLLASRVLLNHAETALGDCYDRAVAQAELDTELPRDAFPEACPYAVEQVLTQPLDQGGFS
jgi:hypothetical protein